MQRFAIFVDGSNLFGSLKALNLEVKDYEAFFAYVYREATAACTEATHQSASYPTQLRRIYWYAVGSMDDWDLSLPQSQTALRKAFDRDRQVQSAWLAMTGKANSGLTGQALYDKAWADCFADFKAWYEKKWATLDGMKRFFQGVRASTDFIDIVEAGHWKVDFLQKYVSEKGLDTSLAVDMVALHKNYDVAIVLSGDADAIPAIRHLKLRNKVIAAVEFINGTPPETKGRTFSSRLREHADFVIRIYETELVRCGHAQRPSTPPTTV